MREKAVQFLKSLKVNPHKPFRLKEVPTDQTPDGLTKDEGQELLEEGIKLLSELQDKLYAHNQHSVLIVLQAMDAAGKDGAIKHVMSGLNPQGVKVTSFKAPTAHELDHDYLWRHAVALPARGEIGIFNRSHYENVLVTRVHPEWLLHERLPGIERPEDADEAFWQARYKQIRRFEKNLVENGTLIVKFFLHVSKEEQKKRFLERIDNPGKNWKFSAADVRERAHWDQYMQAYEEMLVATSTDDAPWYVLPADDKWFTRLCLAAIVLLEFEKLELSYPEVDNEQRKKLVEARALLMQEDSGKPTP
jgi:PPK2 family polyphosphate:nucleotide phosphotransferase